MSGKRPGRGRETVPMKAIEPEEDADWLEFELDEDLEPEEEGGE